MCFGFKKLRILRESSVGNEDKLIFEKIIEKSNVIFILLGERTIGSSEKNEFQFQLLTQRSQIKMTLSIIYQVIGVEMTRIELINMLFPDSNYNSLDEEEQENFDEKLEEILVEVRFTDQKIKNLDVISITHDFFSKKERKNANSPDFVVGVVYNTHYVERHDIGQRTFKSFDFAELLSSKEKAEKYLKEANITKEVRFYNLHDDCVCCS